MWGGAGPGRLLVPLGKPKKGKQYLGKPSPTCNFHSDKLICEFFGSVIQFRAENQIQECYIFSQNMGLYSGQCFSLLEASLKALALHLGSLDCFIDSNASKRFRKATLPCIKSMVQWWIPQSADIYCQTHPKVHCRIAFFKFKKLHSNLFRNSLQRET